MLADIIFFEELTGKTALTLFRPGDGGAFEAHTKFTVK